MIHFSDLDLHPILARNVGQMRFQQPRPIQAEAIPPLRDGRDVLGLAPTGTGKTAAFLLPVMHQLLSRPPETDQPGRRPDPQTRLRALVLGPTRELVQQIVAEARRLGGGSLLRMTCAYGKVGLKPQAERIARGIDLLIATPGRVRELLEAEALSLASIRHVVIDEADRMFDFGFLPQIEKILDRIPTPRQIALFTATMPREIERLTQLTMRDPVRIEIERHTTPVSHVRQRLIEIDERAKVSLLMHLLEHDLQDGILIFCRTRRRVGWVATALARHGFSVGSVHGDRTQPQRERALHRFTEGDHRILVATDVAARGLHIETARTVINYDLPPNAEEFVHRIGRAAHGGGVGEAITFLTPFEQESWRGIRRGAKLYDLEPEVIAGFEPPATETMKRDRGLKPGTRGKRSTVPEAEFFEPAPSKGGRGAGRSGKRMRAGRRKSRQPIPKGEKPGGGVRKPPK
ncbi:MAG: DEAD/DEAH box helicase [Phycisphaerales bacterium]|nr:MAG: DEAD/DEAH box helicase [Phycisphaerales bacterium]